MVAKAMDDKIELRCHKKFRKDLERRAKEEGINTHEYIRMVLLKDIKKSR